MEQLTNNSFVQLLTSDNFCTTFKEYLQKYDLSDKARLFMRDYIDYPGTEDDILCRPHLYKLKRGVVEIELKRNPNMCIWLAYFRLPTLSKEQFEQIDFNQVETHHDMTAWLKDGVGIDFGHCTDFMLMNIVHDNPHTNVRCYQDVVNICHRIADSIIQNVH